MVTRMAANPRNKAMNVDRTKGRSHFGRQVAGCSTEHVPSCLTALSSALLETLRRPPPELDSASRTERVLTKHG